MTAGPVVGIDFDNTLVSYDALLERLLVERGLGAPGVGPGKKALRDHVRRLPGGEIAWQKLQAALYGPRINEAVPSPGASEFLAQCRRAGVPVYVISHKTEFAVYDDTGINLRSAALEWLAARGLFDAGVGLSSRVIFFCATRQEKVEQIKRLGCTHFVDDLEETFRAPGFPASVDQILYAPWGGTTGFARVTVVKGWADVSARLFPRSNRGLA